MADGDSAVATDIYHADYAVGFEFRRYPPADNSRGTKHVVAAGSPVWDAGSTPVASTSVYGRFFKFVDLTGQIRDNFAHESAIKSRSRQAHCPSPRERLRDDLPRREPHLPARH